MSASTATCGTLGNAPATLAILLEKEQSIYRRCPPSQTIPRDEYTNNRVLMVAWCKRLCNECNFKQELVQTAMALADKYMASPNLYSYMKAHYQLIVITCLRIAMKIDSPATAPTIQEISDLCRGSYTCEEIESEEICVLQALAWYLNPPTASQIANHVLALVQAKAGVINNWAGCVDRVHDLIEASVPDLGLSTLRPSTVAMASILATIQDIRDPFDRQAVLRSTLIVMNKFNFDSPCEIDFIRTDLSFLAGDNVRIYRESHSAPDRISPPSAVYQQTMSEAVPVRLAPAPFKSCVQDQHGVCGSNRPLPAVPMSSGEVAGHQAYFCGQVTSTVLKTDVSAQMGYCMPARNDESVESSTGREESVESSTESSETSNDEDRSTSLNQGYSAKHYLPFKTLKKSEERRVARSSLSFHSSSTVTTLDTIPEYIATDEVDEINNDLLSLGVSTLSMR
ncbi:hypothetical protein THAOC_18792 [Thalassiosira oceanica]|uniref:Cyclin-like domain-containing protein n=1 Tax=Thalassiosira oceanica TaxID=159749 RepID=K0SR48_THAOC|nr:hypothetical protein THAOC_18792 [Thalassiosira oceanica]|eukprot:EJK60797.1 hypothetical protein THAOC_18792 [Thalassiosira oceanica]